MQSFQQRPLQGTQQGLICCIERQGELIIAQRTIDSEHPALVSAQYRPRSSPGLFGARSRASAIARLGDFGGLDTMCVMPLSACQLQHVPIHETPEDQIDAHVFETLRSGIDMQAGPIALGTLGLGCSSSRSVMGIVANIEDIRNTLRASIEAGFNPCYLDIEELACIRGLHQTMVHHNEPKDFVLCRYTPNHMILALVDDRGAVHLLRMIPGEVSQEAFSPASIASSISHQIDMLMISVGQQSTLPAVGPKVYIAIDPRLGVNATMAFRRNKMMAAISIDEIEEHHPWVERLMSDHGLDAYEAITVLGMLSDVYVPDEAQHEGREDSTATAEC